MYFEENPYILNDQHGNSMSLFLKERENLAGKFQLFFKFNELEFMIKNVGNKRDAIFFDKLLVQTLKNKVETKEVPLRVSKKIAAVKPKEEKKEKADKN